MVKLQISIPTFNRLEQIRYCLDSLLVSVSYVNLDDRSSIGIGVYNNSTKSNEEYSQLINLYKKKFDTLSINYFIYEFTGHDIGAPKNQCLSILKSKARYTWVLPDDDLANIDSIDVILNTIDKHKPSFIHGGIKNKSILKYYQKKAQQESFIKNKVYEVVESEKVKKFLSTKGIQLQEHVYRTELIDPVANENISSILDDFTPVVFGLLCCNDSRPLIFLSESIGLFRDGDPNSPWRNQWAFISLIKWQKTVDNFLSVKLLNSKDESYARGIFMELLHRNYWRPDFLLGIYGSDGLTPFNLYKLYKGLYLKMLLKSPFFFIHEVFFNQEIKKRVLGKIKSLIKV